MSSPKLASTRPQPTSPRHRPGRFRPVIESLEERCLLSGFVQINLISDQANMARVTDPNLVNSWGIASTASSPFWIADNGTGLSTVYDSNGHPIPASKPLVVTIPPPNGGTPPAAPTGIVANTTSGFVVSSGSGSGPAAFLFATEDGTISGWNPKANGTNAILEVDNSASGAVYKGLALATTSSGSFLYAANFNAGRIDVFDSTFKPTTLAGKFTDPTGDIPANFAPFGIQLIGNQLYVTYAQQNAAKHDDVAGAGSGFVDVFDTSGNFVKRLTAHGNLNSPWGLAQAPALFGALSNAILVGNFGDGHINAYDPNTGALVGSLNNASGSPIVIDGLWGLRFGNGANAGDPLRLYFSAGPAGETHGLFGSLRVNDPVQTFLQGSYETILQHALDAGGLSFWGGALNGGMSNTQVAQNLTATADFDATAVKNVFSSLLKHAPDAAGLTFWSNFLAQGNTIEQLEAQIMGSPEYLASRGQGTQAGLLAAIYQDLLGRAIDSGGQTFWGQAMAGGMSASAVAQAIATSLEGAQHTVGNIYTQVLHRTADAAGLSFFSGALVNGMTDQQIIALLAGSAEFNAQLS